MQKSFGRSPGHWVLLALAGWMNREQQRVLEYLLEENQVLRARLPQKQIRFTDEERARLAIKSRGLCHKTLRQLGSLVTPDTLTRWFRAYAARKYDGSGKRRPGRPPTPQALRELVVQVAGANPGWGYTRLRDQLALLGHSISRTTIQRVLRADGLDPSPQRQRHMRWATFLKAHWGAIAAMDFFHVEVMTLRGPVRYMVLVVMDLKSRRVELGGILQGAHEQWLVQVVRNLTDAVDGFLLGKTCVLLDRDPLFTRDVKDMLKHSGVVPKTLPRERART